MRKPIFIPFIAEINCMTKIKEKMGICKSVMIATVIAIRAVIKNGFHLLCVYFTAISFLSSLSPLKPHILQSFSSIQSFPHMWLMKTLKKLLCYLMFANTLYLWHIVSFMDANIISHIAFKK